MRTSKVNFALAAAVLATAINTTLAQQPTPLLTQPADQLIALLKSDASQKEKVDACRQLAVLGAKDAVPALAALLPDEKLNHMARYALETIPDPAADRALRDALAALKGRPLVGVLGSIGVRKDTQAVRAVAKLLQNSDADVAQAAARALGKIADGPAVEALQRAVGQAPVGNQLAVCEGLLRCAETLNAQGDRRQTTVIYDQLRALQAPQQVRVAGLRGAILARRNDGVSLLRKQLQNKNDYALFATAVRTAYEMPGSDVTQALAAELPQLSGNDQKILVIQALGKRTEDAALPALSAAATSGPELVRIAAIQALAETGHPAAAVVLVDLLGDSNPEISQAALNSFAGLPGKQVDATVQSLLKRPDTTRRLAGIELMGRRRMSACLPDLLKASTDSDARIRPAALSKVGELGGPGDVTALLDLFPRLSATQDLDAAEQALITLCSQTDRPEACTEKLTARLTQAQPGQKGVLLRVLSSVGGTGALQAVRTAVSDSSTEVQGAAIRALSAWKTTDAAPDLLALAKGASNPTDRMLCLRSYLGLAANSDLSVDQRLAMCRDAASLAKGTEERKLLLAALGTIDSPDSLAMIMPHLDDASTKEEACAAVTAIAERMLKGQRAAQTASTLIQPLERIAQASANEGVSKHAKALLQQAQKKASK